MLPEATCVPAVQPSGAAHVRADPVLMRRLITIVRVRGSGADASVGFDASSGSEQVRLNFRAPLPRSSAAGRTFGVAG